jgi:MFS family permease
LSSDTVKQNNRWYILFVAIITYLFLAGLMRFSMVVLFKEISIDLNLNLVDIGAVWGMDPLAGVFVSLLGGLLADRFGVKTTMTVVCFIAGIVGALRGLSGDFTSIAASMFIFGLFVSMIPTIVPKVTAVWFRGRYLALTNASLYIAMSLGGVIGALFSATTFSPMLGGWRNVLFVYGIPAIVISMLWLFTIREPKENALLHTSTSPVKLREALSNVIRIRSVWLIGLIGLTQIGTMIALTAYLPIYLRNTGWTTVAADGATTMVIGLNCLSTIPIVMLSGKLRSHKFMLVVTVITMSLGAGLFFLFDGVLFWILLAIYSLLRFVPSTLINTLIIENKRVGSRYAGTAIGLANTLSMFGGFLFPPLGNSLAAIYSGLPFIFWASMCLLSLIGLFFTRE